MSDLRKTYRYSLSHDWALRRKLDLIHSIYPRVYMENLLKWLGGYLKTWFCEINRDDGFIHKMIIEFIFVLFSTPLDQWLNNPPNRHQKLIYICVLFMIINVTAILLVVYFIWCELNATCMYVLHITPVLVFIFVLYCYVIVDRMSICINIKYCMICMNVWLQCS